MSIGVDCMVVVACTYFEVTLHAHRSHFIYPSSPRVFCAIGSSHRDISTDSHPVRLTFSSSAHRSVKHTLNALFTTLAQSSEQGEPIAPVDDFSGTLEVEAFRELDEA